MRIKLANLLSAAALSISTTGAFAQVVGPPEVFKADEQTSVLSFLGAEAEHAGSPWRKDQCPANFVDVRDNRVDGRLPVTASDEVAEFIGSLDRTEDVVVSPDGERLVIAAFNRNELCIVRFNFHGHDDFVELESAMMLQVDDLQDPHGLAFLDDYTLLVANRGTGLLLVHLDRKTGMRAIASQILVDESHAVPVRSPGSVAIHHVTDSLVEATVCNNYVGEITRYLLDRRDDWAVVDAELLVRKNMKIPDGVAISPSGEWIAISSPAHNAVHMYHNTAELGIQTEAVGSLNLVNAPHGVRFSADGRSLFVVDAGMPYLHTFESMSGDWSGDRSPAAVTRIMTDEAFINGRYNIEEGGTKGFSIVNDHIAVTTSHYQPLAFFRLERLANVVHGRTVVGLEGLPPSNHTSGADRVITRLRRRLAATERKLKSAKGRLNSTDHELAEIRKLAEECGQQLAS